MDNKATRLGSDSRRKMGRGHSAGEGPALQTASSWTSGLHNREEIRLLFEPPALGDSTFAWLGAVNT